MAIKAKRDGQDAEREKVLKRKAYIAKQAEHAMRRALKRAEAEPPPDPEDTPERRAKRQADRRKAGREKGKVKLPGRQRGGAIDATDVALVLALRQKEATQAEIAKVMNIGVDTVARVLADFGDTRPLAKAYLQNKAEQITRDAVRASAVASQTGKGEVALELLDRLDVAPKRQEEQKGSKVVIVVGSADVKSLPALPILPVLDAAVEA
jgi:hypothetical protein